MKYSAEIKAYGDTDKLVACFKAERQAKEDRSTVEMADKGSYLLFQITAEDSVALRATLTSITKLLTVYEKMSSIKNG